MNKVALVIGGSSGIGLSTVRNLINENYIVYNISRRKCFIKEVHSLQADVTKNEEFEDALNTVINEQGRIDFLIYCAGWSMASRIDQVKEEDYKYLFEVNFFGFLKSLTLVVPLMKKQNGGRIIVVSSMGWVVPIPFDGHYSASKSALNILVKALNIELNKDEIYLTSVMPGGTRNHFTYKRKVYKNNSNNSDFYNAVVKLAKIEQKGRSNEQVANTIMKVLKRKYPPILTVSGLSNKLYYLMSKILPLGMVILFVKLKYNIK